MLQGIKAGIKIRFNKTAAKSPLKTSPPPNRTDKKCGKEGIFFCCFTLKVKLFTVISSILGNNLYICHLKQEQHEKGRYKIAYSPKTE